MKVSLDARLMGTPGIGRFVQNLWKGLIDIGADVTGLVASRPRDWLGSQSLAPPAAGRVVHAAPFGPAEQVTVPRLLRRLKIAVHHSPHLTVPYLMRTPIVLTVHDLFPLTERANARSRAAGLYYRAAFPLAVRKADKVVAISPHTAGEVAKVLGVPDRKLSVIEHGVDRDLWRRADPDAVELALRRLGVVRPYLLYVGTTKRHKNLQAVLTALTTHHPCLIVAGASVAEVADVQASVTGRVHVLGRVTDADLVVLYSGAEALLLPSLYEAVGFTALEAMACGTPVIASDGGGLPHTIGPAGVLVPPRDPEAWTEAIDRVLSDAELRRGLVDAGLARVASRPWTTTASAYLDVYASVL